MAKKKLTIQQMIPAMQSQGYKFVRGTSNPRVTEYIFEKGGQQVTLTADKIKALMGQGVSMPSQMNVAASDPTPAPALPNSKRSRYLRTKYAASHVAASAKPISASGGEVFYGFPTIQHAKTFANTVVSMKNVGRGQGGDARLVKSGLATLVGVKNAAPGIAKMAEQYDGWAFKGKPVAPGGPAASHVAAASAGPRTLKYVFPGIEGASAFKTAVRMGFFAQKAESTWRRGDPPDAKVFVNVAQYVDEDVPNIAALAKKHNGKPVSLSGSRAKMSQGGAVAASGVPENGATVVHPKYGKGVVQFVDKRGTKAQWIMIVRTDSGQITRPVSEFKAAGASIAAGGESKTLSGETLRETKAVEDVVRGCISGLQKLPIKSGEGGSIRQTATSMVADVLKMVLSSRRGLGASIAAGPKLPPDGSVPLEYWNPRKPPVKTPQGKAASSVGDTKFAGVSVSRDTDGKWYVTPKWNKGGRVVSVPSDHGYDSQQEANAEAAKIKAKYARG